MNNASLAAKNKKFCGICKAVGKSEEEYSSHFTKSAPGPKGVVTCPLILSSVCKCCSKQGHFADHCPKRAEIEHIQKKAKTINVEIRIKSKPNSSVSATATATISKSSVSSNNRFHLLRDLDDDDVQQSEHVIVSSPAKKTFASVLASAPCAPIKKPVSEILPVPVKLTTMFPVIPKTRRSWVDMMDSDSEDEDD